MKIYIQPNWSEQFILWDENPGIFVGREQEIKNFKHILENNDSSSILVSSVRGVGKTSFIHKTLSETEGVTPIFVNIGHALSWDDESERKKRLVLVSLIRATHFHFEKDRGIEDLYKKCFWDFTIESFETKQVSEEKSLQTVGLNEEQFSKLLLLISTALLAFGISIDSILWRGIMLFLGIVGMFFSFNWKREWAFVLLTKKSAIIDSSTEYLEIEFEKWLKSIREKWKKLIFIIDELDKVDEEESLKIIKEYKNLFTRSFAHFIFIASQRAYDLVYCDREDGIEKGWSFPTFFTHVFYLSLPTTLELREYLNRIFLGNIDKNAIQKLWNYLLFLSGNDFFELKRLIADLLLFDEDSNPYIEIESIKSEDADFERISSLYNYVDKWVLSRSLKRLKKSWKDNSKIQSVVFRFLRKNFNRNFTLDEAEIDNQIISDLVLVLKEIGAVDSIVQNSETLNHSYYWTWKYNRPADAPLLKEDELFIKTFDKLIRIANDLNDFPDVYEKSDFQDDYDEIVDGRDGQNVSGISLFSIYSDHKTIYNSLKDPSKRISIPTEKITIATGKIDERLQNVYDEYFKIFTNTLGFVIKKKDWFFIDENIKSGNHNILWTFSQFPNFIDIVSAYENRIYWKGDQSKYVLIIRYFEDIEHVTKALELLRTKDDILVVNLLLDKEYSVSHPEVLFNKLWRRGKTPFKVNNFSNVHFSDFRELAPITKQIVKFLNS